MSRLPAPSIAAKRKHLWHPVAEKLSDDELDRLLGMLRQNVTRTVASLPEHAAYVARYCGVQQLQPTELAQG